MTKMSAFISAALSTALLTPGVRAATILQWDFNFTSPYTTGPQSLTDTSAGNPITNLTSASVNPSITRIGGVTGVGAGTPNTFAPSYFSNTKSNSSDSNSAASGPTEGLAYYSGNYSASANDKTQGIQINLSTLGFGNIGFKFDGNSASRAPNVFEVQASTDGVTFKDVGVFNANSAVNTWANNNSYTLSGFGNAASVFVNIVSLKTGGVYSTPSGSTVASGSGSATKYDEITFTGTALPEPASLSILSVAGAGLLIRRRGRR